jgi:hypothetical protein
MTPAADVVSDAIADGCWEAFLWAITRRADFGFMTILVRLRSGRLFAIYDEFSSHSGHTGLRKTMELFDPTTEQAIDEIESAMKHLLAPLGAKVHRVIVKGDAEKMERLLRGTPLGVMIHRTWHPEAR